MNDRGWEELVDLLDQKFDIVDHSKSTQVMPDNHELSMTIETIDFDKDGQDYRVSRITSPAILDKKTFYHKSGVSEHAQYVYDPEQTTNKVVFYKKQAGDWEEISAEKLFA